MSVLPAPDVMAEELEMLGIDVEETVFQRFQLLSELLLDRAKVSNLIGPGEKGRLWKRHFLESAAYSLLLPAGAPVVDIGTGAGFPGLVLAVLGFDVSMVEPRRKRHLFLSMAVSRLDLDAARTRVLPCRIEKCEPFAPGTSFTARSVSAPGVLMGLLESVAGRESTLTCREPADQLHGEAHEQILLPVPPLDREGVLVQYRLCSGQIPGTVQTS